MAAVEDLRVDPIELPHPTGEIRLWGLDQQMTVVGHQTVGMAEPAEAADHLAEDGQPGLPIRIRLDDALSRMAATSDMVNRVGEFYAQRPGHGGTVYR